MLTRLRVALIFGLLPTLAGCLNQPEVSPGLEPQEEDYAQARKGFHTKLVRYGPAPQDGEPLRTPPGARRIDYRSGNLVLKAFVTPDPGDGRKHPAVLFLHGGFAFAEDDWAMPQPYGDAGYIVLTPILRAENGQPGSYTMFFDEVEDVLAAADALASLPYVDSGHIYLAGHSAGGTLTMLAAMVSNRFRAAASFSGCTDQKANGDSQPILVSFDASDIREFQLRSPVAFATSFKCPVRLYYGSDESWTIKPTQRTALLAKQDGIDAEAIEIPGDHFSSVPGAIGQSIEFFRRN